MSQKDIADLDLGSVTRKETANSDKDFADLMAILKYGSKNLPSLCRPVSSFSESASHIATPPALFSQPIPVRLCLVLFPAHIWPADAATFPGWCPGQAKTGWPYPR
jgi:hypothetical protein